MARHADVMVEITLSDLEGTGAQRAERSQYRPDHAQPEHQGRDRRQDEAGTPFCITIDGDTLADDTVTVRDRDSCEQIRLPAEEVSAYVRDRVHR